MRRTGNSELRNKILEEAIGIVYREGPGRVTMRSLAENLGYSSATIYLHFENKEELIKEIALHGFDRLSKEMESIVGIADLDVALKEAGRRYIRFGLDHPELYRLMFQENTLSTLSTRYSVEALQSAFRVWMLVRSLYVRGIESGVFRPSDPDRETALSWAAVHGYVQLVTGERLSMDRVAWVAEIAEAILDDRVRSVRPELLSAPFSLSRQEK